MAEPSTDQPGREAGLSPTEVQACRIAASVAALPSALCRLRVDVSAVPPVLCHLFSAVIALLTVLAACADLTVCAGLSVLCHPCCCVADVVQTGHTAQRWPAAPGRVDPAFPPGV
jgi:hypothetical protein